MFPRFCIILSALKVLNMSNLYRSSDDKVIGGVCGGLAHRFDWNVEALRWIFALAGIFSGVALFVYLILWLVLKERPTSGIIDVDW